MWHCSQTLWQSQDISHLHWLRLRSGSWSGTVMSVLTARPLVVGTDTAVSDAYGLGRYFVTTIRWLIFYGNVI